MEKLSPKNEEILNNFLEENNLKSDTVVYRYTSEKHLEKDNDGNFYLKAKENPVDMVIDKYHGHNHVYIAREIGPGLSFLSKPLREYEIAGRICVEAKIGGILKQGGLIYQVSSLPAYVKAFFFTIPAKKLRVTKRS